MGQSLAIPAPPRGFSTSPSSDLSAATPHSSSAGSGIPRIDSMSSLSSYNDPVTILIPSPPPDEDDFPSGSQRGKSGSQVFLFGSCGVGSNFKRRHPASGIPAAEHGRGQLTSCFGPCLPMVGSRGPRRTADGHTHTLWALGGDSLRRAEWQKASKLLQLVLQSCGLHGVGQASTGTTRTCRLLVVLKLIGVYWEIEHLIQRRASLIEESHSWIIYLRSPKTSVKRIIRGLDTLSSTHLPQPEHKKAKAKSPSCVANRSGIDSEEDGWSSQASLRLSTVVGSSKVVHSRSGSLGTVDINQRSLSISDTEEEGEDFDRVATPEWTASSIASMVNAAFPNISEAIVIQELGLIDRSVRFKTSRKLSTTTTSATETTTEAATEIATATETATAAATGTAAETATAAVAAAAAATAAETATETATATAAATAAETSPVRSKSPKSQRHSKTSLREMVPAIVDSSCSASLGQVSEESDHEESFHPETRIPFLVVKLFLKNQLPIFLEQEMASENAAIKRLLLIHGTAIAWLQYIRNSIRKKYVELVSHQLNVREASSIQLTALQLQVLFDANDRFHVYTFLQRVRAPQRADEHLIPLHLDPGNLNAIRMSVEPSSHSPLTSITATTRSDYDSSFLSSELPPLFPPPPPVVPAPQSIEQHGVTFKVIETFFHTCLLDQAFYRAVWLEYQRSDCEYPDADDSDAVYLRALRTYPVFLPKLNPRRVCTTTCRRRRNDKLQGLLTTTTI